MTRITRLVVTISSVLLLGTPIASAQRPPNMIFIMTDDHGWPFYSFMENLGATHPNFSLPILGTAAVPEVLTPKLDTLASQGAVFPVSHSADSVCVPSFRSTLTGLDPKDFHERKNAKNQPGEEKHGGYLATYLRRANYESYGFGKIWQQGYKSIGFSCVSGAESGECPISCLTYEGHAPNNLDECKESIRSKKIGRRRIAPMLKFIDSYEQMVAGADPNNLPPPYFVWYSPRLPHAPFNATEFVEDALCKRGLLPAAEPCNSDPPDIEIPDFIYCRDSDCASPSSLESLERDDVVARFVHLHTRLCQAEPSKDLQKGNACSDKVNYPDKEIAGLPDMIPETGYLAKKKSRIYLQNVMLLDFWIGELLRFLEFRGYDNDTIIFLQTDNGYLTPKSKKSTGENGFRTPFIVKAPGMQAPGVVRPQMVKNVDFLATMMDYAQLPFTTCATGTNAKLPMPSASGGCIEGQTMRPYLEAANPNDPSLAGRAEMFGKKGNKPFAVTDDGLRLFVKKCSAAPKLYDLNLHPDETCDLLSQSCASSPPPAQEVCDLRYQIDCWWKEDAGKCFSNPCTTVNPICE